MDVTRTKFCNLIASAEYLPIRDSCVDKILCSQVLEHLTYPRKALIEMNRVLSPKGMAYIDFPKPQFTNNMKLGLLGLFLSLPFSLIRARRILRSLKEVRQRKPRAFHRNIITPKNVEKHMEVEKVEEIGDIFLKALTFGRKARFFRRKPRLPDSYLLTCKKRVKEK